MHVVTRFKSRPLPSREDSTGSKQTLQRRFFLSASFRRLLPHRLATGGPLHFALLAVAVEPCWYSSPSRDLAAGSQGSHSTGDLLLLPAASTAFLATSILLLLGWQPLHRRASRQPPFLGSFS